MKLFLISQSERDWYDTFDAVVVAADTEDEAKKIHPYSRVDWIDTDPWKDDALLCTWASSPDNVTAKCIGEAAAGTSAGVILASFNAG